MVKEKPLYKVDHVRVYQNMGDERQKVGCSTPERPTRRFIEENEEKYKLQHDVSGIKQRVYQNYFKRILTHQLVIFFFNPFRRNL